MSIRKRAVWLDCDPGHDDAMALILAAHSPELHLLGVSTVHGNQKVEKVTHNALKVLHLCGRSDIDVVAGQAMPLLRPGRACSEIHGESGLDGPEWDLITKAPLKEKAVNVMFKSLWEYNLSASKEAEKAALVCTGSLTNAALLLTVYPEVKDFIEIVLMGGCMGVGNTGPVVEFNMQCDPEAAKIVMESSVEVTIIPLEVTHTALVTPEVLQRMQSPSPSSFRTIVKELLVFFAQRYSEVFSFDHPPLHDPCAVAFVIAPHLFKTERMRVDVETTSELCAGQTIFDVWRQSGRPPNAVLAREMDVKGFWDLMIKGIDSANEASSFHYITDKS